MAQRIVFKRCLSRNSISIVGRGGSSSILKATTIPASSTATSQNNTHTTKNRHFTSISSHSSSAFIPQNINKNEVASALASGTEVSPITKNQRQLQLLQYRNKSFQSTGVLYSDEKAAAPPATDGNEDENEDSIPDYQNPLHHNNPLKQKIMLDEFEEGETVELAPLPPFDDGSGKTIAAPELHDLADEILQLTMYEMKELVDRVQDHFNLEDDDGAYYVEGDGGGGGDGGSEEEAKVEEKTAFDLKLTGFDAKSKIKVIKEVRAITGLGLKEAKEMVEGVPKVVKKDIKQEEADELKAKLEAVGATVEIE